MEVVRRDRAKTRKRKFRPRIPSLSLRHQAQDGGEVLLSMREHPGVHFGSFREDGTHMAFDRHSQLAAPWMGFAAGGIGTSGSARLPAGGRFTFGLFHGAALFPGDHSPEGEDNLAALMEARSSSGSLSLQAGFLHESNGALGIAPEGAFGHARSRTFFGGLTASHRISNDWSVAAAAFVGRTVPSLQGFGAVREIDPLVSSSFGLALQGSDILTRSDSLDLSLSQPLRIESGSALIDLPAGRTRYGEALRETLDASLEPSGREIDFQASYMRSVGAINLHMTVGWVDQRGHVRSRDGEAYGLLQFRRTF